MIFGLFLLGGGILIAVAGWIGTASIEPDEHRSFWLFSIGTDKNGRRLSFDELMGTYTPWGIMLFGLGAVVAGLGLIFGWIET